MPAKSLEERLDRLYASVGAARETDMSKLPAKIRVDETCMSLLQDFSGGLTRPQIENAAMTMVYHIAHLRDYLERCLRQQNRNADEVKAAVDASPSLKIIIDLSNVDKHGYPLDRPPKDPRGPKVEHIRCQMRMQTAPEKGAAVTMQLGPKGVPVIRGKGTACAVTTGDVVGKDGQPIGDLFNIAEQAIGDWETLLARLGLTKQRSPL